MPLFGVHYRCKFTPGCMGGEYEKDRYEEVDALDAAAAEQWVRDNWHVTHLHSINPVYQPLTIRRLTLMNAARVERWHSLNAWSALEWAGAMAGEVGEACNAAKKLKRIEDNIANINEGERALTAEVDAAHAIGMEVADTVIYGVLLCLRVGVDLEACIRDAFNKKSEQYGFPERL